MDVFPIKLLCCREKGWSEYGFRAAFIINKPDELPWYGYDVVINSPTSVTFLVWDMYDNVYGGCGSVIAEFTVEVKSCLTRKFIISKAASLAVAKVKADKDYEDDVKAAYCTESILNNLGI